jgi:uncharacterized protein (TIGR02444 family)
MASTAKRPHDTPLWTFSLVVYGSDGVADECLGLQEKLKLDVNLLLFAGFVGAVESIRLDAKDIAAASAAIAAWHDDIVRPLRRARRALKPASADSKNPLHDTNATLRAQVKAAELEAEKIEQAMLWQWSRRQLASRPQVTHERALMANLRGVLDFYGAAANASVPHLLDAAMSYRGP